VAPVFLSEWRSGFFHRLHGVRLFVDELGRRGYRTIDRFYLSNRAHFDRPSANSRQ